MHNTFVYNCSHGQNTTSLEHKINKAHSPYSSQITPLVQFGLRNGLHIHSSAFSWLLSPPFFRMFLYTVYLIIRTQNLRTFTYIDMVVAACCQSLLVVFLWHDIRHTHIQTYVTCTNKVLFLYLFIHTYVYIPTIYRYLPNTQKPYSTHDKKKKKKKNSQSTKAIRAFSLK